MIDFNPFEDIVLAAMGQDLTSGSNGHLSEMQFSVELGTAPHVALQIFDTSRGGGSGVQIAEIRWENIDDWLPGYVNKSRSDVMTALREMVRDNFVAVQKTGSFSKPTAQLKSAHCFRKSKPMPRTWAWPLTAASWIRAKSSSIWTKTSNTCSWARCLREMLAAPPISEQIMGTSYNDILAGYAAGLAGTAFGDQSDYLYGFGGDDAFSPGNGQNVVFGGEGVDTAAFGAAQSVVVNLGAGERLARETDENGNAVSSGAQPVGDEAFNYFYGTAVATYSDGNGTTSNSFDHLHSIENVSGSTGNDIITGDSGNNLLEGGLGNDRFDGGGGNDTLDGGGDDDTVSCFHASGGVTVNLTAGAAAGPADVGGGGGNDSISGNAGLDYLEAGAGNDVLFGGANNDVLKGGADDDTLDGGAGADTMTGGTGVDLFILTGGNGAGDRIMDFGAVGGAMRSDGVVRMDKIKIITSDPTLTKNDIFLSAGYVEGDFYCEDLYIPKLETGGSDAFERVKIHFPTEFFTRKTESLITNVPTTLDYLRDQIEIVSVADTLTAVGDTALMAEDGGAITIDVLNNDLVTDAAHTLTLQSVIMPANGTAEVVNGQVRYTPNADYNGTDTFSYTMTDTASVSATGSVSVAVSPVTDRLTGLTLSSNSVQENQDGAVIGTLSVNDPDGGRPVEFFVRNVGHLFETDGNQLKVLDGVSLDFDGDYSPPNAQSGYTWDAEGKILYFQLSAFPYRTTGIGTEVIDYANGMTNWYSVAITEDPYETAPVAVNDTFTFAEEQNGPGLLGSFLLDVLANDTDADAGNGDTLKVTSVGNSRLGSTFIYEDQIYWRHTDDAPGTETISYTIADLAGNTATASFDLTVTNVNDAPRARDDAFTIAEDSNSAVSWNVLSNDLDNNIGDTLRVDRIVSGPSNGNASAISATSVTYTPNENFYGTDSFTYLIYDNANASSTATVTVTVTPQDDAPNAQDDSFTVTEDTADNVLEVLANDVEVDGEVMTDPRHLN